MAFGIKRIELQQWKQKIDNGHIAFLTHFWQDPRFPHVRSVTKVGCQDLVKLASWGKNYGLKEEWIHVRQDGYSHYDLLGPTQEKILKEMGLTTHLSKFCGQIQQSGGE
ncbi:hypothetical protein J2S13_000442 [Oikeobacillus pervagus]|uniref:YneQ n=1 Tax=Oikeobacillus pervagus TaxID=1325931 RepID=A0AAJ1SYF4_9BACI|nr:hypothetical protein [Oikeobacillus pervagus]MDQ0214047.1 hypothetical protein [Oikeobacillus pervagus]